jgi:hypothetical protein
MPANLPPQYYELERQFNKETDIGRSCVLAKELLAIMPKHKGTDKLQAEMKAKISKLTEQSNQAPKNTELIMLTHYSCRERGSRPNNSDWSPQFRKNQAFWHLAPTPNQ